MESVGNSGSAKMDPKNENSPRRSIREDPEARVSKKKVSIAAKFGDAARDNAPKRGTVTAKRVGQERVDKHMDLVKKFRLRQRSIDNISTVYRVDLVYA